MRFHRDRVWAPRRVVVAPRTVLARCRGSTPDVARAFPVAVRGGQVAPPVGRRPHPAPLSSDPALLRPARLARPGHTAPPERPRGGASVTANSFERGFPADAQRKPRRAAERAKDDAGSAAGAARGAAGADRRLPNRPLGVRTAPGASQFRKRPPAAPGLTRTTHEAGGAPPCRCPPRQGAPTPAAPLPRRRPCRGPPRARGIRAPPGALRHACNLSSWICFRFPNSRKRFSCRITPFKSMNRRGVLVASAALTAAACAAAVVIRGFHGILMASAMLAVVVVLWARFGGRARPSGGSNSSPPAEEPPPPPPPPHPQPVEDIQERP